MGLNIEKLKREVARMSAVKFLTPEEAAQIKITIKNGNPVYEGPEELVKRVIRGIEEGEPSP